MPRPVLVGFCVLVTMMCLVVLAPGEPPATAPASSPAPLELPPIVPASQPALPTIEPGMHDLFCTARVNGKERRIAYTVFIPKGYDPSRKWPILLYMIGRGDRGSDHRGLYNNGPPVYLKTNKALADWAPFIMLAPQCPEDARWEEPGWARFVLDLLEFVQTKWSVDPSRMYLTGLSMGGQGVWNVALQSNSRFAVVSPFCAIEVASDRMSDAIRNSSVCIICGGVDGNFTLGSRKMFEVLRQNRIDVTYAEIPNKAHGVWPEFYANRKYYEYLLLHQLGHKPPTTRPLAEELVAISYIPSNAADRDLVEPLKKFLPWWFVSNCGKSHEPGLHDELLGRKNVLVTTPLGDTVPCRLLFTAQIPKDKKTTLNLTVAAHTPGQWELVVRAEGKDLLRKVIGAGDPPAAPATQAAITSAQSTPSAAGVVAAALPAALTESPVPAGSTGAPPATAPALPLNTWIDASVDLTPFAGGDVHLEVLDQRTNSHHSEAYWGAVNIVSQ